MRLRTARIPAIAAGLGLLAGCGGPATATLPLTHTTVTTTTAASTTSGPNRPKIINPTGRSPCGLIPQSDATRFEWEGAPVLQTDAAMRSPQCSYGTYFGSGSVTLDDHDGITEWTTGKFSNGPWNPTNPVLGFPAITWQLPYNADPGTCDVTVDVAPSQVLDVSVSINSGPPLNGRPSVPPPCVFAHQWAEAAMATLLSQN